MWLTQTSTSLSQPARCVNTIRLRAMAQSRAENRRSTVPEGVSGTIRQAGGGSSGGGWL